MAGIKVTDLPVLGAAETDDVFYIVDTSTNTSKQIEVGDLFSSGTFTPTISAVTNDAIVSISDCFFAKVGKWGNLSFVLDCQMDAGFSGTSFQITLPFTTDNISVLTFGNQS